MTKTVQVAGALRGRILIEGVDFEQRAVLACKALQPTLCWLMGSWSPTKKELTELRSLGSQTVRRALGIRPP